MVGPTTRAGNQLSLFPARLGAMRAGAVVCNLLAVGSQCRPASVVGSARVDLRSQLLDPCCEIINPF